MTLQEEVTCIDSPPKYSAAYSQDTRRFFNRHGLDDRSSRVDAQQQYRRRFGSNHDNQLDNFSDDDGDDHGRCAASAIPYEVTHSDDDDDDHQEALLDRLQPACNCRPHRCYHDQDFH